MNFKKITTFHYKKITFQEKIWSIRSSPKSFAKSNFPSGVKYANFTKRVLETALKVEANTTSSYILYQPIVPVKIKKFAIKRQK